MDKKLLVVSSHQDEAITQWVRKFCPQIAILSVPDLLKYYDIFDEIDDTHQKISWQYQHRTYTNDTHFVLNRILNIEEHWFAAFAEQERNYAQREFEAYLGFALNAFQSPQQQAINGLCERYQPLPQQWQTVKQIPELAIPCYHWGKFDRDAKFSESSHVVHSQVFDPLNWSLNNHYDKASSSFCFIKPQGTPLWVGVLGRAQLITSSITLSHDMRLWLANLVNHIQALFGYFLFEILFFVECGQFTFGCIHFNLIQSAKNPYFNDFMQQHLLEECALCRN